MNTQTLHVRIVSPKEVIFEGEALSVSSTNSQGPFDILVRHANFITLTENKPILIEQPDKKMLRFTFPMAIIATKEDRVDIYTDIQIPPEELER